MSYLQGLMQPVTWKRVKAGLYHASNDTVVKRERGRWIVYRGRFDFFSGRKTGVLPGVSHGTLRAAQDGERSIRLAPWLHRAD